MSKSYIFKAKKFYEMTLSGSPAMEGTLILENEKKIKKSGNGKLKSYPNGKQKSHHYGKRKSQWDGKRNSHSGEAPVGYKEKLCGSEDDTNENVQTDSGI